MLGDCHVADAPRNDVLDFAPRNDVPVVYALNIPAGQWQSYEQVFYLLNNSHLFNNC